MVRVGDMGSYSYQLAEPGQAVVCQHEEDSPNLRVSTTEVYFSLTQNWIVSVAVLQPGLANQCTELNPWNQRFQALSLLWHLRFNMGLPGYPKMYKEEPKTRTLSEVP